MKLYIFLSVFAFLVINKSSGSVVDRRQIVALLDDGNLKKMDMDVRREILIMIVQQINKTATEQRQISKTCELKINGSIDSCTTCNAAMCTPQPPPVYAGLLLSLGTMAFQPVLVAGELVKVIGSGLSTTTAFLGDKAGEFVKDLGGTAKSIGNGLKDGVSSALETIGGGFDSLGDKFTDLGNTIASGSTDLLNGIGSGTTDLLNNIGSEFTGLPDKLGSGLDSLGGSLTDLGNQIANGFKGVGSSVGSAFGHIFGKKRCVQSCPMCDKLDVQKHSKEEVLKTICGADTIGSQRNAIETIAYLRSLYNTTLTHQIVSKVEYDPTSIKTTGGVAFSTNFVTYSLYGQTIRVQSNSDLMITDITSSAKKVAHQILGGSI